MLLLVKLQLRHRHWHCMSRPFPPYFSRLRLLSFSGSARPVKKKVPQPDPAHFMVGYLVRSCGLSPAEALKASGRLTHLSSPEKPEAVLRLLKQTGFRDDHIARLVRSYPCVLVANPEKTLEPKIRALQQQAGFSEADLAELISINPQALLLRDPVRRIEFWRKLLGDNAKILKLAKATNLICCNIDDKIGPNIRYLHNLGMSNADIVKTFFRARWLATSKLDDIISLVDRVKSRGVAPGSGLFVEAMSTLGNLADDTIEGKSRLLLKLGWTADELFCAFRKFPAVLRISEKKLTRGMNFLVEEAGYSPSYVARYPMLLGYSIERRLIPRHHVLQLLKEKGLPRGNADFFSVMVIRDEKFVERFVIPFAKHSPGLLEIFPVIPKFDDPISLR